MTTTAAAKSWNKWLRRQRKFSEKHNWRFWEPQISLIHVSSLPGSLSLLCLLWDHTIPSLASLIVIKWLQKPQAWCPHITKPQQKGLPVSTFWWEVRFPGDRANNFLHVIGSAGLCSYPMHHTGSPHSLIGFSWEQWLKSFVPKSLAKQLLVVESSLGHKRVDWNPLASYSWKPWAVPSHLHISAKEGISHCEQDTHRLTFTLSQVYAASFLTQLPTSATLKSLLCALWKHYSTINRILPITLLRFLPLGSLSWNRIHS